jgi:hypothetical protein
VKIELKPTEIIDTVVGPHGKNQARIWVGTTERGVPIKAWIVVVQAQTHDADALAAFDAELREVPATRELSTFDLRLVL